MVEFIKKKLHNGLTILFEKRNLPVVSIGTAVRQGFAYENEKKKGISHVMEHLTFKGTLTRSYKEIAREIEKKGGVMNAFTDEELTCFWNKIPSKYSGFGIDIASDLILNPKIEEVEFEKEKKVILEEIKMYHDNPQSYVFDKIKALLYKKPFGISGIGTPESVFSIKRKELFDFFNKEYKTNKMILCAVGNTSLEELEEYGKKFPFSKGSTGKARINRINKRIIEKRKGVDQANYVMGIHACNSGDKKRYSYELINTILAEGLSSRLFEEIREKRGLAYAIKGGLELGNNFGHQLIYVGTTKDKIKACEQIILKEINKIKSLELKDLNEAKEQLIGLRKVSSEESASVMTALIHEEIFGNAEDFYKYEEEINKVKLEETRKLGKIKNYSSIALIPA